MSKYIFRTNKKEKGNFTQIDDEILYSDLSERAKLLMWHMLSKPDDWEFFTVVIAKEMKWNKETVKNKMNELIAAGYVDREEIKDGGKFNGNIIRVFEHPTLQPNIETAIQEFQPETEKPTTKKPATEKPTPEESTPEKPSLLICNNTDIDLKDIKQTDINNNQDITIPIVLDNTPNIVEQPKGEKQGKETIQLDNIFSASKDKEPEPQQDPKQTDKYKQQAMFLSICQSLMYDGVKFATADLKKAVDYYYPLGKSEAYIYEVAKNYGLNKFSEGNVIRKEII